MEKFGDQGRSKVVAAFGRKPLNFRIPSGLAATLEQPWFGALQFTPWRSTREGMAVGAHGRRLVRVAHGAGFQPRQGPDAAWAVEGG